LVALVLAYPVIESLDQWDAPGPASDSEIQVIGLLAFACLLFLLAQLVLGLAAPASEHGFPDLWLPVVQKKYVRVLSSSLTASPPIALRI